MTVNYDLLTLAQLQVEVNESVTKIQSRVDSDIDALGVDDVEDNDETRQEVADDIETASGGALPAAEYVAKASAPSYTPSSSTPFARVLDDGKRELMTVAASNINVFTRLSLVRAQDLITDIEALLSQIEAEAAQLQIAAAAGLLLPPNRSEVSELRGRLSTVKSESDQAVIDLRSGKARRDAARRQLGDIDDVVQQGQNRVDGRFLEPMTSVPSGTPPGNVNDAFITASPNSLTLSRQAQRPTKVSQTFVESIGILEASALERIGYIALCMAISSLNTQDQTRQRAERLFEKLKSLVQQLMDSLESGFIATLQTNLHELAADVIDNIADAIQDKLDAFDLFLSTSAPRIPTFVTTVSSVGEAPELPITESLAAQCDLSFQSFCDMQGLLEVAKSLDAELGLVQPRAPAIGRARLVLVAEAADLERPLTPPPDQEARLILSQDVGTGAVQVVARFPRADVRPEISAPAPVLSGFLSEAAGAGAVSLLVTGLAENVASLGSVIVNPGPLQETLRYSSWETEAGDKRFTLIDTPASSLAFGAPVEVSGEQRNTFQDAFTANRVINGGPGTMVLSDDGARRERLRYLSSSFDADTGDYTFVIDTGSTPVVAAPDHKLTVLCRPAGNERQILYKDTAFTSLLAAAERFKVVGDEITHLTNNNFDFTSGGTFVVDDVDDYDSSGNNVWRLTVGNDRVPLELDPVGTVLSGTNTKLKLKTAFHGGDQSRVVLARVPRLATPVGSSKARVRLDRRRRDDLRVSNLAIGATAAINGRVILDGGGGTSKVSGFSASITSPGASDTDQTLTPAAPIVRGDEAAMPGPGAVIEVQGGRSMFSTRVTSADAVSQTLAYDLPQRSGTVSVSNTSVAHPDGLYGIGETRVIDGTGTSFLSEYVVGDYTKVDGVAGVYKVIEVRSNTEMVVDPEIGAFTAGSDHYIAAPSGIVSRAFTVHRTPQETIDFVSVTNVDGDLFDLNLSSPTVFSHSLQEADVPTSVQILPEDSVNAFRAKFSNANESVKPRFDGSVVPPGTTTLRAEFEEPAAQALLGVFVENASTIILPDGRSISTASPNTPDTDLVYSFDISSNPLTAPLAAGDVIEVETTSVFDQLKTLFPDTSWSKPFDDALALVLDELGTMESKLCRLLGGRPQNLAIAALAVQGAVTTARLALVPIRLLLASMALGLPESETVARVRTRFESVGMDAAVDAVDDGDVTKISGMTPSSATREGQAREALSAYRDEIQDVRKTQVADSMIATLSGREQDKAYLADFNRPFSEIAKDKLDNEEEAIDNLKADAEEITS